MCDLLYKEVSLSEETAGCLLCNNAACTKACPYDVQVDSIIRSARFENILGAVNKIPNDLKCLTCESKECMKECVKSKVNKTVAIDEIMKILYTFEKTEEKKVDISMEFCGIHCENPFFLSSSIVGSNYEMVKKAFEMGWGGVAFKTIGTFIPNEVSPRFDILKKEGLPFVGLKNIEQISDHSLEENIEFIKKLKEEFPEKIIIASIMGQTEEEWTYLAKVMTEAKADIIECNFSCPHMTIEGTGSDVGENPEIVAKYTAAVRRGTKLPILAKMTPNIGDMTRPAIASVNAGADGIAAINTIKSIMNIDLDTFVSGPEVQGYTSVGGYSGKAVKPIALRFIHSMKTNKELKDIPVSGMGGIESYKDALEFISLGCENIQITTSVMQYGYRIIEDLIEGTKLYLSKNGYEKLSDITGKSISKIIPAENLERDSICFPKFDREKCVSCGRCYISCFDAGHQALTQDESTNKPIMDGKKCAGCHLCMVVCPVSAISKGNRILKSKIKK